ncbi:MAG: DUF493 domain-containing protein [Planctomycetota bacterium]
MDRTPPTLELLESRHDFPGPYTFKVIGGANADLPERVARCVQDALELSAPPPTSIKTAEGGRHESVTVEPECPDAASVLRLYAALRELDGVLYLF